jgi:hypothetical protein
LTEIISDEINYLDIDIVKNPILELVSYMCNLAVWRK